MKNLYFSAVVLLVCFLTNAQIITIPDANFKAKLLEANTTNTIAIDSNNESIQIDTNNNGEIEQSEALLVYKLFYSPGGGVPFRTNNEATTSTSDNISDLTGIEYFSNLRYLNVTNNLLTSINLTSNTALTTLYCGQNDLTSINVTGLSELRSLFCDTNSLSSLDLSTNINLQNLHCSENSLTELNLANATQLTRLDCDFNQITSLNFNAPSTLILLKCSNNLLTSLNLENYPVLLNLECESNELTSLSFNNNTALESVSCRNNNLVTLDFSSTGLKTLSCGSNPNLTFLNVKNGFNSPDYYQNPPFPFDIASFYVSGLPSLSYICHDEYEFGFMLVYEQGIQNVPRGSYCNFTPGGSFNTITGSVKYDCSGSNTNTANAKIVISDGVTSGSTFANQNGDYTFYVGTGAFTVQPQLINSTDFVVTPVSTVLNFTELNTSQSADFCIDSNGINSDISVTIVPLNNARPGFDSNYMITIINNGNQIENGTLTLNFPDNVTDLVTATPALTSQSENELVWNYSNLTPFSSTSFYYTLNLNTPSETPALTGGELLLFTANATSSNNPSFTLEQTVVNSFDPNDKNCLEGSQIDVSEIGDYLHYVVRFQNTGTAAAENVVVKDVLSAKLDWNTVEMIGASHPFRSTLTLGNKLEFFFENINLPTSASNEEASQGYVAFKVKPKNTVVVNDVIQNTADIYFDYNFSIVTNTTSTQVALLGNETFNLNTLVSIAPNPAKDILNIQIDSTISMQKIEIYNTLGQLLKTIPNPTESNISLDVSEFHSGTYLITFQSQQGKSFRKFVKL